jgi:2-keto-3-deoxy-L-rhamnonate aldolase RhmA
MSAPWQRSTTPALGIWIKFPLPEVLEVLVGSGVDFVVLDCEHGAFDRRSMSSLVGVARGLGLSVFVRVPGRAPADLYPPLDAGADGLFVPHVDDATAARLIVDACRFPPLGNRPASPTTRAGGWGRTSTTEYLLRGNTEVTLVAQVESPAGVANAGDIAAVAGLDAVFIGPFDLALASGLSPDDPAFHALLTRVEAATDGRALGGVAGDAAQIVELADRGYAFLMIGADTSLLAAAASSLVGLARRTSSQSEVRT